jgi:hypothetical protein
MYCIPRACWITFDVLPAVFMLHLPAMFYQVVCRTLAGIATSIFTWSYGYCQLTNMVHGCAQKKKLTNMGSLVVVTLPQTCGVHLFSVLKSLSCCCRNPTRDVNCSKVTPSTNRDLRCLAVQSAWWRSRPAMALSLFEQQGALTLKLDQGTTTPPPPGIFHA